MILTSRVERVIAAAHHNGPDGSRCQTNHGHDWSIAVEITFNSDRLDKYGWGPDFAKLKDLIDKYDHQDLNTMMDVTPSAENFAMLLWKEIHEETGFAPDSITVGEGNGNYICARP